MNIGNVLDDMGNPEEALVELKKGLDVLVTVHGHEHWCSWPYTARNTSSAFWY